MGFPPSSPWNMNWADIWSLTRENREGRLLCPLARLVALWGGGGERGGGGGGVGEAAGRGRGTGMASLPISCLSAQSFVSPLASHVPYCLCVSIYSQLLLSGSKIPLSWARPTLIARNILRLRLALHIWHILSIRDICSRAHRKQTNGMHRTVFSLLSGERGAERIFGGDLKQRTWLEWTLFKNVLKDEIQGHSGPILGSATNVPSGFYSSLCIWGLLFGFASIN